MTASPISITVETWPMFLRAVRDARAQLGNPDTIWYRGQANENYNLLPSLVRHPKGLEKEHVIFNEYERSASHLLGSLKSEWEMLSDMQHYGIPTRLLDWTDVLGIAIAFAVLDKKPLDTFGSAIYLLSPNALNDLSGLKGVKRVPHDPLFGYKDVYWHGKPFSPSFPIAIDSKLHNERLRAQNGSFTMHGRNPQPLEFQAPETIRKIILKPSVRDEALEFLDHANLNTFSIYPDIAGMARHINRKHLSN